MRKPNLTKICRSVKTATVKHSPEILTGIGIAGRDNDEAEES